jgi:hypothetical protein
MSAFEVKPDIPRTSRNVRQPSEADMPANQFLCWTTIQMTPIAWGRSRYLIWTEQGTIGGKRI